MRFPANAGRFSLAVAFASVTVNADIVGFSGSGCTGDEGLNVPCDGSCHLFGGRQSFDVLIGPSLVTIFVDTSCSVQTGTVSNPGSGACSDVSSMLNVNSFHCNVVNTTSSAASGNTGVTTTTTNNDGNRQTAVQTTANAKSSGLGTTSGTTSSSTRTQTTTSSTSTSLNVISTASSSSLNTTLQVPNTTGTGTGLTSPTQSSSAFSSSDSHQHSSRTPIIGAVVGSILGLIFLVLAFISCRKYVLTRRNQPTDSAEPVQPLPQITHNDNTSSDLLMQMASRGNHQNANGSLSDNRALNFSTQGTASLLSSLLPRPRTPDILRVDRFLDPQAELRRTDSIQSPSPIPPRTATNLSNRQASPSDESQPRTSSSAEVSSDLELGGGYLALAENSNPRVRKLMVELRRELAGSSNISSSQGQSALPSDLLSETSSGGGESGTHGEQTDSLYQWNSRQSVASSTLPPPYTN